MVNNNTYKKLIVMSVVLSAIFIATVGITSPKKILQKQRFIDKFWYDKVFGTEEYEVVFLGDSRLYRGFSAGAFEKAAGLPKASTLNFGFSSGGINTYMIKKAQEKFTNTTKKKSLVLALTPYSLNLDAYKNEHFKGFYKKPPSFIKMKRNPDKYILFITPLHNYLKTILTPRLQNTYIQKPQEDGWIASNYSTGLDTLKGIKRYKARIGMHKVSSNVITELSNEVKRLIKENYTIIAYRVPSCKTMEAVEDSLSGFNEVEIKAKLQDLGVIWIDMPNRYSYTSYDGSHLIDTSAIRFSEDLGKLMKPYLNP